MLKELIGGEEASRECPNCHSKRNWKDGITKAKKGSFQRYVCRDCGRRFKTSEILSIEPAYYGEYQVCVSTKGAKNLISAAENKTVAGASPEKQTYEGQIIELMLYMKKQGFPEITIKSRVNAIEALIHAGANLENPEAVKLVIANKKNKVGKDVSIGHKKNLTLAYDTLLRMQGKTWDMPKYKRPDTLPFVPQDSEIDQIVNSTGRVISLFCDILKETGADPGEAKAIEWTEVDFERRTITINHPVKGHKARIISVSRNLINRLDAVPKTTKTIFNVKMRTLLKNYWDQRKTAARKFSNPRLLKINFTTFRHWKATTEYHKTKDILWVMRLLGHNSLKTTLIYIDLEIACYKQSSDEFTVKIASNINEFAQLLEVGFEYVGDMDGKKVLRRRK